MTTPELDRQRPSEAVAGILAAASMAASAWAWVERPGVIAPGATLVALVAVAMAGRYARLAAIALAFAAVSWVAGMTIAVALDRPLF